MGASFDLGNGFSVSLDAPAQTCGIHGVPIVQSRCIECDKSADTAWRDAYYIAWIGASNPSGVAASIDKHTKAVGAEHVAVRAMAGHLAYLRGESLGPEAEELEAVRSNAERLGLL
jgi:hypothetical protein